MFCLASIKFCTKLANSRIFVQIPQKNLLGMHKISLVTGFYQQMTTGSMKIEIRLIGPKKMVKVLYIFLYIYVQQNISMKAILILKWKYILTITGVQTWPKSNFLLWNNYLFISIQNWSKWKIINRIKKVIIKCSLKTKVNPPSLSISPPPSDTTQWEPYA